MNGERLQLETKVTWISYAALLFAVVFFSGIFSTAKGWLQVFDFTVLQGAFGTIGEGGKEIFRGSGGTGARDGFLFAITLMPSVILALGVISVVEGLGGLAAAQKLMSPLLKPLIGIPGICGLALIASFQSTDAGAGMTKSLYESGAITDDERTIFATFQISADATITNYFSSGAALFALLGTPIIVPFVVILVFKIIGANLMRLFLKTTKQKANDGLAKTA